MNGMKNNNLEDFFNKSNLNIDKELDEFYESTFYVFNF